MIFCALLSKPFTKIEMFVDEGNFPRADFPSNRIQKQTFDQSKAQLKTGLKPLARFLLDFSVPNAFVVKIGLVPTLQLSDHAR